MRGRRRDAAAAERAQDGCGRPSISADDAGRANTQLAQGHGGAIRAGLASY